MQGGGLVYRMGAENSAFCLHSETGYEAEFKGGSLFNVMEESPRQSSVHGAAWVLLTLVRLTVKIRSKKQKSCKAFNLARKEPK